MANTLLTAQAIAKAGLAALYDGGVMSQVVHRDYEQEFVSGVGKTINVRKPATFVADTYDRANGIQIQDAFEQSVPVTLDTLLDVSFSVTSEDLTLDIADFQTQLLDPAIQAIIEGIEKRLSEMRRTLAINTGEMLPAIALDDPKVLTLAGAELTKGKAPQSERYAVVGPDTYTQWITKPPFDKADSAGSTSALRDASLGRAYGFDTFQSADFQKVSGDASEIGIAFHKTALALVTRPLALPKGATNAYVASYKGFGIRVVIGYDMTKKSDVVSVDTLVGTAVMDYSKIVALTPPVGP